MKKVITGTIAGLGFLAVMMVPAMAAPSDKGQCRQAANDLFVALSSEGTRGDFMSDVIFGNEPNMINGAVVPTQSPGPFVNIGANEPPRNDRTFGFTGGDLQALVKASCNS